MFLFFAFVFLLSFQTNLHSAESVSLTLSTVTIVPQSKDFGEVQLLSNSLPQIFIITNSGSIDATINEIDKDGSNASEFSLSDNNIYPITLNPGLSISFSVTFSPISLGGKSAFLRVLSSTIPQSVINVPLSGVCVSPFIATFPYVQNFETNMFPPNGWLSQQVTGIGLFKRVSLGVYPTVTPKSGIGMLQFESYIYPSNTSAIMITPPIDFAPSQLYQVRFWMYRDSVYSQNMDRFSLFYNSSASLEGADSIGNIYRNKNQEPFVQSSGWNEYFFDLPVTVAGNRGYLLFKGVSDYGNNIYIDSITIQVKPSSAVEWANVQMSLSISIVQGNELAIYTQGFTESIVPKIEATSGMRVWIGINEQNSDPNTWTRWIPATFNTMVGSKDEYRAEIGTLLSPGSYFIASRWQYLGGPYRYGGASAEGGGFWNGTTNVSVSINVNPLILSTPSEESFDSVIAPTLPNAWTIENHNTDEKTWGNNEVNPKSSPNSMRYRYHDINSADDWFFSPGITLQKDTTYQVSFWYRTESATYPEKLEVKYGNSPSTTGMTSGNLFSNQSIYLNNVVYKKGTGIITPALTGIYYVGWHCISDPDMYNLYIDDISIKTVPGKDAGVVSVDMALNSNPGIIYPSATVKNFGGLAGTFNVTMKISDGYSSTKTVSNLGNEISTQVYFDSWNADLGHYEVTVITQLIGDMVTSNDTLKKEIGVFRGNYTVGNDLPISTYFGGAVGYSKIENELVEGYTFCFGGNTSSGNGTECYKYKVSTDTWSNIAPLPEGRKLFASAICDDYIYVIGGTDINGVTQTSVFKYNINSDVWTTVASLPLGLSWSKATVYNKRIYLAGGINSGNNVSRFVYVYDIEADQWASANPLPQGRFGGAFSNAGNKLVYIAGSSSTGLTSTVYVGSINKDFPLSISWKLSEKHYPGGDGNETLDNNIKLFAETDFKEELEKLKEMSTENLVLYPAGALFRFDAAQWGNDAIITAGGSNSSEWVPSENNSSYIYIPSSDEWIKHFSLETKVFGGSVASLDMGTSLKLIVAGGNDGSVINKTQIWTDPVCNLELSALIEGLYTGEVSDTVYTELRSATEPFEIVDRSFLKLDQNGKGKVSFRETHNNISYYLVLKHRNAVETWSKNPVQFLEGKLKYDFTNSQDKAFGNNLVLKGDKWCIYSGDINKDGLVDLSDIILIEIDKINAEGGYLLTDLNGDSIIDNSDLVIAASNNQKFISKKTPLSSSINKIDHKENESSIKKIDK